MPTHAMQLGEIDRSKSPASVRAAASRLSPLDPEVQAIQNIPILIAQYNIEIGHYEDIVGRMLESTPQTRQLLGDKVVELGQRLENMRLRLGGLRERLAADIRGAYSAGFLTFDEAAATGAISTGGLGLGPLAFLAIGLLVAAVIAVGIVSAGFYRRIVVPIQAEEARVQGLRKWIDQEIDASNAATSAGGEYKPQPLPDVLKDPQPTGDGGGGIGPALAAGAGLGVVLVGLLALVALSPRRSA